MVTQLHTNEARNANWRFSAQRKNINNDIADMEQRQEKKLATFANLGSDLAMKGLMKLEQHRIKKNTSEAMYDWYRNKYQGYLGSDDAKKTEAVLKASNISSGIYHQNLKTAQEEGVPQDLIDKGAKRHPAYLDTIAQLETTRIANKFAPTIEHGMLTDETELFRENGTPFILNTATTVEDKMLAHHYLSRKFLEDNNINNDYGNGYLALPTDQGGSGFFAALDEAESGEGGLFSKYRVQAAIQQSREREAITQQAYIANPTGENFQKVVNAITIGVTDKSAKRSYKQITELQETFLKAGLDSGHLKFNNIVDISNQEIPGTRQKTQNAAGTLVPIKENGKIVGYAETYGSRWPTKYGYDPEKGVLGSMLKYADDAEGRLSDIATSELEREFPYESEALYEEILEDKDGDGDYDLTRKQVLEKVKILQKKFGYAEWANYEKINEALDIHETPPALVDVEIENWKAWLADPKTGGRLSDRAAEISPAALRRTWIKEQLAREAKLDKDDNYKDMLKAVENLPKAVIKGQFGTSYGEDVDPGHVMIIQQSLKDYFNEQMREKGLSAAEAMSATRDHYLLNGGDEAFKNSKKAVDALGQGASNMYSLNGTTGKLINKSLTDALQVPPVDKIDFNAAMRNKLDRFIKSGKGSRRDALSATKINSNNETVPAIQLNVTPDQPETKEILENMDINKPLEYLVTAQKSSKLPLSQVINSRRKAWGLSPLAKEDEEALGGHISKNLSQGLLNQICGNDDGLYDRNLCTAEIQKASGSATGAADLVAEEFADAAEAFGAKENLNDAFAFWISQFGIESLSDFKTAGINQLVESYYMALQDPNFVPSLLDDPDFNRAKYGADGNLDWYPYVDGLADLDAARKERIRQKWDKLNEKPDPRLQNIIDRA
tara:strand:- start:3189 stop:5876 length:2688 start_codon:yes stop_codon:yes gene_type:complete